MSGQASAKTAQEKALIGLARLIARAALRQVLDEEGEKGKESLGEAVQAAAHSSSESQADESR